MQWEDRGPPLFFHDLLKLRAAAGGDLQEVDACGQRGPGEADMQTVPAGWHTCALPELAARDIEQPYRDVAGRGLAEEDIYAIGERVGRHRERSGGLAVPDEDGPAENETVIQIDGS